MARFDVHPMPGHGKRGFVLDVQANLLNNLRTRTVVPLLPKADAPVPIKDLNPVFDINGEPCVMLTQAIASVLTRELREPVVSLNDRYDDIRQALDILLLGF